LRSAFGRLFPAATHFDWHCDDIAVDGGALTQPDTSKIAPTAKAERRQIVFVMIYCAQASG
jgi:hypothetical protein